MEKRIEKRNFRRKADRKQTRDTDGGSKKEGWRSLEEKKQEGRNTGGEKEEVKRQESRGCLQSSFFRDPKNSDVENKKHKIFYNTGWEDIQK